MTRLISTLTVSLVLSLAMFGCAKGHNQDIKTQAEANPQAQFSGVHSYGWMGAAAVVQDPEQMWSEGTIDVSAEVKRLIDDEMRARGWSESSTPDMLVAFLVINDVKDLEFIKSGRAGGVPDLVGVGEGSLIIEIIDAKTKQTLWLGAATAKTQSGRSSEVVKQRLHYVVHKLLTQVPQ